MHVTFLCPYFEREDSRGASMSVSQYSHYLLSHLPREGNKALDLIILTTYDKRTENRAFSINLNSSHHQEPLKATVRPCFQRGIWGYVQLFYALRKIKPDITHIQHQMFLYGGAVHILLFPLFIGVLRMITVPVVTLHDIIRPQQIDRNTAALHHFPPLLPPSLIKFGLRTFFRLIGICCHTIIVHEPAFADALVNDYGIPEEKVWIIRHGVIDPTLFVLKDRRALMEHFHVPSDAERIFGFFGFVTGYKGIEYLLDEFERHMHTYPKSVLIIGGAAHPGHAGSKRYRDYTKFLMRKAKKNLRVVWHGPIPDAEIGSFYQLVDCFVLPYRTCFGQSGPLSYAIGAGKPFFVSEYMRPLVPFKESIFYLKEGALADKLNLFSDAPEGDRAQYIHALQSIRQKRQWKDSAHQTWTLYEMLLRQAARRHDTLILGAYGQENLGDEILLGNCLSLLKKESCIVASSQPTLTRNVYGVLAVHSHKHPLRGLLTFLGIKNIIIGGGEQFHLVKRSLGKHSLSLIFRCFIVTLFARLLRKKIYFIAVGIGNISSFVARMLTQWSIRMATFTTFRDKDSYSYCLVNIPKARTALSADLAFISHQNPPSFSNKNEERRIRLGIAPTYFIDHPEAYQLFCRRMGVAVDGFLGLSPKRETVFLPFQKGFRPHSDIISGNEILAHVEQSHRCQTKVDLSVESVGEEYRSLSFLWGARLHSLILACLFGVPFVALIYDIKVKKFLEEIEYTDWSIDLDKSFSVEKLLALQKNLEEHAMEIRNHLMKQAEKLQMRVGISGDLLLAIAQGKPFLMTTEQASQSLPAADTNARGLLAKYFRKLKQHKWK